jgi:uncharacterized protein (TIGR04255 family)
MEPTGRPEHLPDFTSPPLNEVVLGVQYSAPHGYQQVQVGEVRNLFSSDFPITQEHMALPPAFETFGLPKFGPVGNLELLSGPVHSRYWFVNASGHELIQFQQDRLLHNWRRLESSEGKYPRFESMLGSFASELAKLENYINTIQPQSLLINQCEITYINHIHIDGDSIALDDWFKGSMLHGLALEEINLRFSEVIRNEIGARIGRLIYEVTTGFLANGQRIIVFNLTARGAPDQPSVEEALRFVKLGRELIVTKFADLTTASAHTLWGRKK